MRNEFPAWLRPALLSALVLLAGCTRHLAGIHDPPRAVAVPTAHPWTSLIYAARTDSGVVVVDLGWYGAERSLRRALGRIGVRPEDVTDVFLTHTHRDHVGAWRAVRGARFHVAEPEAALLVGSARHADLPSRLARRIFGEELPGGRAVRVHPFGADTVLVLGRDTLRAFVVPGHTQGSAAYLFRGVLFVGDAVSYRPLRGFGGAVGVFTRSPVEARASLASLWERALPHGVEWVCNAHAKCARPTPRFLRKTTREPAGPSPPRRPAPHGAQPAARCQRCSPACRIDQAGLPKRPKTLVRRLPAPVPARREGFAAQASPQPTQGRRDPWPPCPSAPVPPPTPSTRSSVRSWAAAAWPGEA